jgi:hypothetical protein
MTEQDDIDHIKRMTHVQMCSLLRFAKAGHPYFDVTKPFHEIFDKRFKEFGGMTPEISKLIGWEK